MPDLRTSSSAPRHALLAGGGSGGHVFPALAVASELQRRGWEVSWAGNADGMEARLVARHGLELHPLAARPLVGQGVSGKLSALATLGGSAWRGRDLVRRLGACVVLGTGGYVSAPAVIGGRLAGRPVILLEPNADPGVANRMLSRFVSEAAVAYEATAGRLACRTVLTGVPVREEFFTVGEPPAGDLRILVLGGSQGARQLNRVLPRALRRLAATGDSLRGVSVLHQAGEKLLAEAEEAYATSDLAAIGVGARVVPFVDDVAGEMAASHLLISRAGAITLAEICAAGRPSLLVPLSLAGAHQVYNAEAVAAAGAARVVREDEVDEERLAAALGDLLGDRQRLATMGRAARALARRDAAAAIADRVERLGDEKC